MGEDGVMDGDTEVSRHIAVWAAGLARSGLRHSPRGWVADSPMGEVVVEFSPANEFGVLDHVVRMLSGDAVYNSLRVVPAGPGSSVARWCSACGDVTT